MILRKVNMEDWPLLLEWRNDIETRNNSHHPEPVAEEDHKRWLNTVLNNPNRHLYIAVDDNEPVGTVRADFEPHTQTYELSWTISPQFRGKGVGKKMVGLLVALLATGAKVRAEVKKGNIASAKIAESAGLSFQKEENNILHYSNYME
ncbi:GNAT family N-acetyltransferase [Chitinophaga qingshengii]|uniref:GNAT family N-acetyltransferase n=2 Tax=Chitinophaga qingshengii TaxID=1569794 RepID=A0ABR7TXN9_9BACT|nr:GNAT family N-acetyltransferase [Chitinophaga qingshengii]